MVIRKTSALVESGLLAALAALFTLIGTYIPILDALSNFLWPVALILCGRRHGLKWSMLCLVVSSIIIALLLSPLEALIKLVTVSFTGITVGECMRRQISPLKTLFYGSIATLLSVLAGFGLSYAVMQVNPFVEFENIMTQSMAMSKEMMASFGLPKELEAQLDAFPKMAMLLLPACLVMGAPFSTAIDYLLARKVLSRLGDYYPPFPPFSSWRLPKWILMPYGLALVGLFMSKTQPESMLYSVSMNIFYCMCLTLTIETLAVLKWYVETKGKPKAWFYCGAFLAFTNPLVSQIAIIAGAYDLIFNFRVRYGSGE